MCKKRDGTCPQRDSRHTGEILLEKYPVKSGHEFKAKTSRKLCGFIFVSPHSAAGWARAGSLAFNQGFTTPRNRHKAGEDGGAEGIHKAIITLGCRDRHGRMERLQVPGRIKGP